MAAEAAAAAVAIPRVIVERPDAWKPGDAAYYNDADKRYDVEAVDIKTCLLQIDNKTTLLPDLDHLVAQYAEGNCEWRYRINPAIVPWLLAQRKGPRQIWPYTALMVIAYVYGVEDGSKHRMRKWLTSDEALNAYAQITPNNRTAGKLNDWWSQRMRRWAELGLLQKRLIKQKTRRSRG